MAVEQFFRGIGMPLSECQPSFQKSSIHLKKRWAKDHVHAFPFVAQILLADGPGRLRPDELPSFNFEGGPAMTDSGEILEKAVNVADETIRRLLDEGGVEMPHLVIKVTPNGEVVLRSNASPDILRAFAEDLVQIAAGVEASPARR